MRNFATTGSAKRRREQLRRAFQRWLDEQYEEAQGHGPACVARDGYGARSYRQLLNNSILDDDGRFSPLPT